jgi:chemotaxis protein CheZ
MANQVEQIQQAVTATLRTELEDLRSFIDRRIAELSAEVHATVELMDFSETNLSSQLRGIREQIAGVIALPSAATRNSGLELEAVVQATESAANRIMEAAEAIGDWLRDGVPDPSASEVLTEKVNTIFEACSFQDVTGQRIRRAIQHLQQVESMLCDIAPSEPVLSDDQQVIVSAPFVSRGVLTAAEAATDPDLEQAAIDSLFG